MPAFVVARFDDGGVEVVSQNWLSKDQSVVRWPRLIKNAAKFRDCVISHEAPADSWTECRIERIYCEVLGFLFYSLLFPLFISITSLEYR